MNDVLTIETLRKALIADNSPPSSEPYVVLHPLAWDNLKEAFNLTEAQMGKWFVKATYIEVKDA